MELSTHLKHRWIIHLRVRWMRNTSHPVLRKPNGLARCRLWSHHQRIYSSTGRRANLKGLTSLLSWSKLRRRCSTSRKTIALVKYHLNVRTRTSMTHHQLITSMNHDVTWPRDQKICIPMITRNHVDTNHRRNERLDAPESHNQYATRERTLLVWASAVLEAVNTENAIQRAEVA